jgi:hypothetical protein
LAKYKVCLSANEISIASINSTSLVDPYVKTVYCLI